MSALPQWCFVPASPPTHGGTWEARVPLTWYLCPSNAISFQYNVMGQAPPGVWVGDADAKAS